MVSTDMEEKQARFLKDLSFNGTLAMRDIFLTFCMGTHDRLGQTSQIRTTFLEKDTLRFIWTAILEGFVKDFSDKFSLV